MIVSSAATIFTLNQINSELKSRDDWIRGGLEAYEVAVRLRDANQLKVTIALVRTINAVRLFGQNVQHVGCYCIEFRATDEEEYSRTLFLAG